MKLTKKTTMIVGAILCVIVIGMILKSMQGEGFMEEFTAVLPDITLLQRQYYPNHIDPTPSSPSPPSSTSTPPYTLLEASTPPYTLLQRQLLVKFVLYALLLYLPTP